MNPPELHEEAEATQTSTFQFAEPHYCPSTHVALHAGDEDCLYLNIHSPILDAKARRPVLVYIHGGYIHFANGSMQGYTPNAMVTKDLDVVFVSIQYRSVSWLRSTIIFSGVHMSMM